MKDKKIVVFGVANDKSIAWGIAKSICEHGGEIILTYQNDVMYKRVKPLSEQLGCKTLIECDVLNEKSLKNCFEEIKEKWGQIDGIVHSIASSDKDELKGRFINTSKDNFTQTMVTSCYSLVAIAQEAEHLMQKGGSIVTLSYLGAECVMPNYNVMGVAKAALESSVRYLAVDLGVKNIRVNAISAGPVRTLASSGIGSFRSIFKWNEQNSPLKRNTTTDDIGGASVFLLSELGKGTTGEILHVDAGYHVVGMKLDENL